MEVHLTPEQEARLTKLAASTGRNEADIAGEVIGSYIDELADVQQMLDRRYDDFKRGNTKALTPEQLEQNLERRKQEFLRQRNEP